jgi:hypothetical protein
MDILLYPTKRHTLILQPEISYAGVFDFLTGQEPECYQLLNSLRIHMDSIRGANAPERLAEGRRSHKNREE